jgi:hypothetical protein
VARGKLLIPWRFADFAIKETSMKKYTVMAFDKSYQLCLSRTKIIPVRRSLVNSGGSAKEKKSAF